ncbi:MAG: 30S ribosomal protein S8e [Candidatus Bathyarchaeia archaeon]
MTSGIFKRKYTGGKSHPYRKKRKRERPGYPTETRLGKERRKTERVRGGSTKLKLITCQYANVSNPKTGKATKVKILDIVKNPASFDYSRRKILTRGAIIRTKLGLARVSSRPGQDGVLNAKIIGGSD